jgi:very-short-patch-repair endonuclease
LNVYSTVAERQYGVITRAQLRAVDLTDRQIDLRLASGALEIMHPGVYRVAGSYPSARQRAMAACLWCGDDAMLSHFTGAHLFHMPTPGCDITDVTVPPTVRRRHEQIRLHRSATIERHDRFQVDGLPCTSPTRTMVDLAAHLDGEQLEHCFEWSRRHGLTTKTRLERAIDTACGPGRPGTVALRELLRVVEDRPKESRLEVRTAALLRKHSLHPDATQHRVDCYRIDFVWLLTQFALECDGFEWHGNRLAWKRDRKRIARLEGLGWRFVHVTWDDVHDRPAETIARIRNYLA